MEEQRLQEIERACYGRYRGKIPEVREEMLCWGMEDGFRELERGCCIQSREGVLGVRKVMLFSPFNYGGGGSRVLVEDATLGVKAGFQELWSRCVVSTWRKGSRSWRGDAVLGVEERFLGVREGMLLELGTGMHC